MAQLIHFPILFKKCKVITAGETQQKTLKHKYKAENPSTTLTHSSEITTVLKGPGSF